jgi:periplasmic divalent cation tolerance protein
MSFTPRIVLVTASGADEARALAGAILEKKLAACVNILPGVESHYWWQGKLDSAQEVLLVIKSSAEQFDELAALVKERHSYECPEIIALAPQEIAPAYRKWWEQEGRAGQSQVGG